MNKAGAILLILGLGLSACAKSPGVGTQAVPEPAACAGTQPAAPPDGTAAAMVRIARGEWRKWGERVVELQPGRAVVILPNSHPAMWEEERDAFPSLADYWCATPPHRNHWELTAQAAGYSNVQNPDGSVEKTAFRRTPIGMSPFDEPWSAAFTSWVIWMAGVPDGRFLYSDTHWDYINDIMTAPPGARAFRARPIAAGPPLAGDLVCATRSGAPPADWRELTLGTRPMHCDIVVGFGACDFSPSGRCIEAIGGNVMQSVSLTRAPVDAAGNLVAGGATGRDWIVVLENAARFPALVSQR
jgi:hypothetical protein